MLVYFAVLISMFICDLMHADDLNTRCLGFPVSLLLFLPDQEGRGYNVPLLLTLF